MMKGSACSKCLYYDSQKLGEGFCRRLPPEVVVVPGQNQLGQAVVTINGMHPPVSASFWCGEFTPSPSDGEVVN